MSIEATALELYVARSRKAKAWARLKTYRQDHGACEESKYAESSDEGCACYYKDKYQLRPLPFSDWCSVCQGSQPLYNEYREATIRATSLMHKLMHLCAKAVPA